MLEVAAQVSQAYSKVACTTDDELMAGLISCLDLKSERFALPLNFYKGINSYLAVKQEDALFGTNVDAYSMPWLGASQANPDYVPAVMIKGSFYSGVRWAAMSAAHTEEASIAAFILEDPSRLGTYFILQLHGRPQGAPCGQNSQAAFPIQDT